MNASFIATGILTVAGAVLLLRFWPRRRSMGTSGARSQRQAPRLSGKSVRVRMAA
jgi:hypothetical protein